jgi:hypothetical protein
MAVSSQSLNSCKYPPLFSQFNFGDFFFQFVKFLIQLHLPLRIIDRLVIYSLNSGQQSPDQPISVFFIQLGGNHLSNRVTSVNHVWLSDCQPLFCVFNFPIVSFSSGILGFMFASFLVKSSLTRNFRFFSPNSGIYVSCAAIFTWVFALARSNIVLDA